MNKPDKNTDRKEFEKYIHAISVEIQQAQIKLVSAANIQMLLHYWKVGHFILFNQKQLGWGSKFIENIDLANVEDYHPLAKSLDKTLILFICS